MDHHQKHSNNANFLMSSSSSSTALTSSPTTFVQADTHTFRELVQKLTGADDNLQDKLPITLPSRYSSSSSRSSATASPNELGGGVIGGPRRSAFKLQERRQNMRKLEIKLGLTSIRNSPNSPTATAYSPRELMQSCYLVGSPVPSPVTPLGSDTVFCSRFPGSGNSSPASVVEEAEEKAIAEKGFYLHPSPLSTPRGLEPPELLPLFPLESPKQKQQSRDL